MSSTPSQFITNARSATCARTQARAPANPSSSALVISTATGAAGSSDDAAARTAATPDALSTAPGESFRTTLATTARPPTAASAAQSIQRMVRDEPAASVSAVSTTLAPSTAMPAIRTLVGTGCDLLSTCATSHTRGAAWPRRATRFSPSARSHGRSSTASPTMIQTNSTRSSRPAPKTIAAASGTPSIVASQKVTSTDAAAIAPPMGVP